jgi:hypothetical protein
MCRKLRGCGTHVDPHVGESCSQTANHFWNHVVLGSSCVVDSDLDGYPALDPLCPSPAIADLQLVSGWSTMAFDSKRRQDGFAHDNSVAQ